MKLYVGIKAINQYIYVVALDNQGVAVLKNQFPITASYEAILHSLDSLKEAFQAPLKIAICSDDSLKPSFIYAIEKHHGHVKLVKPSFLYSTNLMPEDDFEYTIYRQSLQLALLRSLSDE
jgi:hypothetical protein